MWPNASSARSRWSPAAIALILLAVVPAASSSAAADSRASGHEPYALAAAPTGDFSMNLYKKGDFVSQATAYWCIGASMQMMLNVIGVTDDARRASQERNMRVARSRGDSLSAVDHGRTAQRAGGLRGAGSGGWARGLVTQGARGYEERAMDDYQTALRTAAYALRRTNRPVGLIVWRGAHAWVMTGFTATGDPLTHPDYRVTGVYIQDPWYPRVSSIWGPGQKPNSWISRKVLRSDFLPRRGGRWHAELAGMFVLVLPVDPIRSSSRRGRVL